MRESWKERERQRKHGRDQNVQRMFLEAKTSNPSATVNV